MTQPHGNTPIADAFVDRCATRDLTVGVVGLGYVGLPIAAAMLAAGFDVLGYDIDADKIEMLSRGDAYLKHLGQDLYDTLAGSDRFEATSDPAMLARADTILLCVPTPLLDDRQPDLSFVERSVEMVARTLRRGQLIVLESTSYPGTTREVALPTLDRAGRERGLVAGQDWFLAYSPEREDPGRRSHSTQSTPRLVGGIDKPSARVATVLYESAVEQVVTVSSPEVAEAAKLLENIYRAVNIALVNELKPVLQAMDIDIWEVIEAAATKPYGFARFDPGPGLGGHCIPIDPFYLAWRARQLGHESRFIELAGEINSTMPGRIVGAIADELEEDGTTIAGADVLIVGVAYKRNVDDIRETPAAEIIEQLRAAGAHPAYHDPLVEAFPPMRRYAIELNNEPLTAKRLARANAVVIVTDHDTIDYALIGQHARLIIDTRNAMARVRDPKARIVKA